jgi:membrane protein
VIATLHARLERLLFRPQPGPGGRPLDLLLRLLRYLYAILRDLSRGELTLRAMSLVYTTLLSIVPLLALSFSVLKGLGYHRELEPLIYQFLAPLGERAGELTSRIMEFVDNVQGGVLGSIGLAFLFYTVITMIQKVEASFNFVWQVEQPRSFARRVSEYLTVMIVGPVFVVIAVGLIGSLASHAVVQKITLVEPFGRLVVGLGKLATYLIVAGVFGFLYSFIPNTQVRVKAAAIAGVVAGCLWVAAGRIFASFVAGSSRTTVIYAGFAIVIVALFWLYLSWLILLIGAQLAFYIQHPNYLRLGHEVIDLDASQRERLALAIMSMVTANFVDPARPLTLAELAERMDVPSATLAPITRALEVRGILLLTEAEGLVPGRAIDGIELQEVVTAVRHDVAHPALHGTSVPAADRIAAEIDASIDECLRGRTLRDLL